MFFTYRQNNSGGSFIENDKMGVFTIIEAANARDANRKAETIGMVFDGVAKEVDCECCGDRWREADDRDGNTVPTIYGEPYIGTDGLYHSEYGDSSVVIHTKGGNNED